MHVKYDTKGICAVRVEFDVEDGVVKNISFLGGCDGNHKGLAALGCGGPLPCGHPMAPHILLCVHPGSQRPHLCLLGPAVLHPPQPLPLPPRQ